MLQTFRKNVSRWAIHFSSLKKNAKQVEKDLKRDGIPVVDSVEKNIESADELGNVWFDKTLLVEVPQVDDDKLYFPETGETQGRYAGWPYCLDAYQYAEDAPSPQAGGTLRDDAKEYDRHVNVTLEPGMVEDEEQPPPKGENVLPVRQKAG